MNTRQQHTLEKTPDEFLGAEGHTACRNTIGAACWSLRVFASKNATGGHTFFTEA